MTKKKKDPVKNQVDTAKKEPELPDFNKAAENLFEQSFQGYLYWNLLTQFQVNTESFLDEINMSPGFYNTVYASLQDSLLSTISKLYDRNDDALSVYYLKRRFREEPTYCENKEAKEFFNECCKEFRSVEKKAEMLREIRNRYIAHNDKSVNLDICKLTKEFELRWGDVERLLKLAIKFTQGICVFQLGITKTIDVVGLNDWSKTLECVKFWKEYQINADKEMV